MTPTATEERPPSPGIDPRLRARRVAVRRDEGRRRLHLLVALGGAAVVVAAGVGVALSPLFDVDVVRVEGAVHQARPSVLAAGGVARGDHLVLLDGGGAAAAIEALPWVDEAEVDRSWPGTVEITVVERVPVAGLAQPDGRVALVDADRRVLDVVAAEGAPPVVPVRGTPAVGRAGSEAPPGSAGAVALVAGLPDAVRPLVEVVDVDEDGSLSLALRLPDGGPPAAVLLGEGADLGTKLSSLATIVATVLLDDLETIDLRVPSTPALTRR